MSPIVVIGAAAAFLLLTRPGKKLRRQAGLGGWRRLNAKRTGQRQNRRRPRGKR